MATWYSASTPQEIDRLLAAWSSAPIENVELCSMLLEVAQEQVIAYAPAPVVSDPDTGIVNFQFSIVDGAIVATDLVLSSDVADDFTGTVTAPASSEGVRFEFEFEDGEVVGTSIVTGFDEIPSRYVYAQLQQAKNLWAAGEADQESNIGAEGYSFQPRPLDKVIRQLIRPQSGAADVF